MRKAYAKKQKLKRREILQIISIREVVCRFEISSTNGAPVDLYSVNDPTFSLGWNDATLSLAADYSSTNVQVEGVDEADILKNDGNYIYTIAENKLVIVEAFLVENMKKLSETAIEEGYRAIDLYVSDNKLFLVTDSCKYDGYYYSKDTINKILVYDITDKTLPQIVKTFEFKGFYSSSRKIGDKVYVFSNLAISNKGDEYVVPEYRENSAAEFQEISLNDIQYVPNDTYTNYIQLFVFDLWTASDSPKIVTYLGNGAKNIYMSQENLYMAQSNSKETTVYKFSLRNEYPRYESRGKVPGEIVNQFAMDEYEESFRIATTKGTKNSVYILSRSMHILGSITGIAPRETIKSVRFEGNRGYVVTFRNTDSVFVIDLSKVRAPKVLGELKITGYSTYLHPYDENHVIGFGYDGTEGGTNGKLKIVMFDVTDVNNPREKFKEQINASTSELLTNHKSLLFSKKRNLVAFSVGDYSVWKNNLNNKIGKGYTVNLEEGFVQRGDILHEGLDVNRMLYMDDVLYGVSHNNVSAHDINTTEEINRIEI